jgi:hypothetical protein
MTLNFNKLIVGVMAVLMCACTPAQRPLKNGQGYLVVPITEKQFRIEYYLKHAKLAETYWNTTAAQLCPDGFQVLYNEKRTLNFDMYVPIAGNNVNIGRQEFIQYGQVVCTGAASGSVELTQSKWKEFSPVTRSVAPVSDRWLTETLRLYVGHLPDLPVTHPGEALEKIWGKPWKRDRRGSDALSIWMKGGDSWFPNYVGVIERNDCLHLALVLPGTSAAMMGVFKNTAPENINFEHLLTSGKMPAYFYYSKKSCGAQ